LLTPVNASVAVPEINKLACKSSAAQIKTGQNPGRDGAYYG
jgi:hypothetical protein